jgi:hypothetical protein
VRVLCSGTHNEIKSALTHLSHGARRIMATSTVFPPTHTFGQTNKLWDGFMFAQAATPLAMTKVSRRSWFVNAFVFAIQSLLFTRECCKQGCFEEGVENYSYFAFATAPTSGASNALRM